MRLCHSRMLFVRAYPRESQEMVFDAHDRAFAVACPPASGWEKGQVENQVGLARERFFAPRLRMRSYEELNAWLLDQAVAYAKAHPHPEFPDRTVWQAFEAERPSLVPYAGRFDGFHALPASVSKTCLVRFDNNRYSVAANAVGRPGDCQEFRARGHDDGKRRIITWLSRRTSWISCWLAAIRTRCSPRTACWMT